MPCRRLQFFWPQFLSPSPPPYRPHHNRRTLEDAISQIREILKIVWWRLNIANSRILWWLQWGEGRVGWQKLVAEKIEPTFSIFSGRFDFLGCDFHPPISPHCICRTIEDAISQIWGFCDCDEGRSGWQKLLQKSRKCQQGVKKNVFQPQARWIDLQTQSTKKYPCFLYAKFFQTTKSAGFSLTFTNSRTKWRSRSASFNVIKLLGLSSTQGGRSAKPLHRFGGVTCSLDSP